MSDMLNEKFEKFLGEQKTLLEGGQDPMPTVTATVIPGTGSDSPSVSGDPQQKSGAKDEPSGSSPTVPPSVANGQSVTDLGGSQSEPLHSNKEEGEDRKSVV